jgi:hypothetical protein
MASRGKERLTMYDKLLPALRLGAVLTGIGVQLVLPTASAWAEPAAESLAIELNKLEPNGQACRAYLVLKNAGDRQFDSLKLDLVMFDRDGIVAKRLAVQAAPLPAGKTSLKVFDIEERDCAEIGSILLNDIMACEPLPEGEGGCLALVAASSRGGVPFIK